MLTSRCYESEHDLRHMQDMLMAARAAADDAPCVARYPHIGVATFRFFMVACHLNPYEHVRLWHDRQGRLVAYALLGEDPSFDCEVALEDDYARFMRLPCYDRELDIVTVTPDGAHPGGSVAALVTGWADPVNRIGEIDAVSTRPAYRRQGFMRAALLECLRRMQAGGMTHACVSTGETNTPARRLYESIGFRVVSHYLDYVKPPEA